jgi:FkbM family methyltransferase
MLRRSIKSTLAHFGLRLERTRPSLPYHKPIDIFPLCAQDLMQRVAKPFVVQIGANDGVRADPVRSFITQHQWPALLVEPDPIIFEELKSNYAMFPLVQTRNFAISDQDGALPFYVPNRSLVDERPNLSGLSSISQDQLAKELAREGFSKPYDLIDQIRVPGKCVSSLISDEDITKIDVLQIDTEGSDWRILSQFDLAALQVKLINVEFFHLSQAERHDCIKRLADLDYRTAFYLGDLVAYRP